jgi:hypothetical protein
MSKYTKEEQLKLIHAIPESKLNELASHLAVMQGSGKYGKKGTGFWGDAWAWLKTNVGPVVSDIGKTLLKDILVPMLKQKISQKLGGKGLSLAGGKKKGKGLKLAGTGKLVKGSQEAKDHMAKLRAMRKPK